MDLPVTITAVLEGALNRYLELDPDARTKLLALEGKVIAIDVTGLEMTLTLTVASDKVHVMSHYEGEVDTRLKGAPFDLLKMSLGQHSEQALFAGEVEISGDTEAGQKFNQILKQLDIDWEEHLSNITGDVIAHQLGRGFRNVMQWGQQVQQSLSLDVSEYLQEETRLLVTVHEVQRFNQQVDSLRNAVERTQVRLEKLQRQMNKQRAEEIGPAS